MDALADVLVVAARYAWVWMAGWSSIVLLAGATCTLMVTSGEWLASTGVAAADRCTSRTASGRCWMQRGVILGQVQELVSTRARHTVVYYCHNSATILVKLT